MNQENMQQCIQNCHDCARVCLETYTHCLTKGGKHADPKHLTTLLNCSKICETSSMFMITESPFHTKTCGVCTELCEACAEECEAMGEGDEAMMKCAAMCRKCAETCKHMSSM